MTATSAIAAILQTEDIEGLIELGAPADEYSDEAARIGSRLNALAGEINEDQVLGIISTVWEQSFGLSSHDIKQRTPALRRVAGEIVGSRLQSARRP